MADSRSPECGKAAGTDVAPEHHKLHTLSAVLSDCAIKLGRFDHLSQRVDVGTEGHPVIDWRPEQPSANHELDSASKRWKLSDAAQERHTARARTTRSGCGW